MWELTIIDNDSSNVGLQYFYDNIFDEIRRLDGNVFFVSDKRLIVNFDEKNLAYGKALVKQIIAEAILEKVKPLFLEKELKLSSLYGLQGFALMRTICMLDKAEDIREIKSEIVKFGKEFHLDTFWYFNLMPLKSRWKQLCEVLTINMIDIVSTNSFLEIVRYLLKMLDKNFDTIFILETKDEIGFYNQFKKQINCKPVSKNDKQKDEKVLQTLIEFAPSRIDWESETSSELKDLVLAIFN